MSNEYLNHNVPGCSSNYDGGPSGGNLPEAYNYDYPEHTISTTEDTSNAIMVNGRDIRHDVELYRWMLCNLEFESEEDREKQDKIFSKNLLRLCREQVDMEMDKMNKIEESLNELQSLKTTTEIKEENLPFEERIEPPEYLSEIYLETANKIYYLDTNNSGPNEFENNRIFLQQHREPEEIMYEISIQVVEIQPEVTITKIKIEQYDEIEEDLSFEEETEPLEYQPEIYSETTENYHHVNTTDPGANELEGNIMFLQQSMEPEEMDEINLPQVEQQPEETPSPIDTTTNPRANELDNGNTNIIEHSANVLKRTRKIKEVISTPTRFSSRIKKSRIM